MNGVSGDREALERRYLALLRCYPAAYRRARGSELLGTLLEAAAPGQRWPDRRECRALALGGLRARTGADRVRSRGELWLGAVRLAVLLLLAHAGAVALVGAVNVVHDALTGSLPSTGQLVFLAVPMLAAAALPALAAGRPAVALVLTTTGAVLQQVLSQHIWMRASTSVHWIPLAAPYWGLGQQVWQLPLAALLLVPLLRWRPPAARHPWRWLLSVPVALLVLPVDQFGVPASALRLPLLLAALVWCLVDARVPVAVGVLLLAYTAPEAVDELAGPAFLVSWPSYVPGLPGGGMPVTMSLVVQAVLVAVLVAAGAWRATGQARP
jgi:hypothetical protein